MTTEEEGRSHGDHEHTHGVIDPTIAVSGTLLSQAHQARENS